MKKPYRLRVKWGRVFHQRNQYSFATAAERKAFLWGAEQSQGWEDFEYVEVDDTTKGEER